MFSIESVLLAISLKKFLPNAILSNLLDKIALNNNDSNEEPAIKYNMGVLKNNVIKDNATNE